MRKRYFNLMIVVLIVLVVGFFAFDLIPSKEERIPYKQFYEAVINNEVGSVEIKEKSLDFVKTKEPSKTYTTENPESPELKEFLLRNGVTVKEDESVSSILSLIFDVLFYGVFFVIIFFVFKKFISPNTFKTVRHTGVTFNDIVGMDSIKKDMMQIADMLKHSSEYKKRGIRLPKGILLEGAPGNGKTLFARALAAEGKVNFIPAKATDFESMFMAIGPMKVKLLFKKARRRAPCIVFIDEFDGIGTRRNYSGSAIETENTRIVTALLNELDGFEQNEGILVLAATNSREALDEALIRPGRFDAKYIVPYPDYSARQLLVQKYLAGKKYSSECTVEKLATLFDGFSCAKIESVLNRASLIASQKAASSSNDAGFTLSDISLAIKES